MNRHLSDETRTQLTRVARGGALNLVGMAVSGVSGFALVALVANYFDPATAGALFSSTAAFLIVVALVLFGADTGIVHFVLKFEEQGRSGDILSILRVARRSVAVCAVALTVAAVAGAPHIADWLGLAGEKAPTAIGVLAIAVPLTAWSQLAQSETRADGRMRPTVVVDLVFRSIGQVVAVLAVGAMAGGIVALTVGWVVPYVAATALSVPLARGLLQRRSARWTDPPRATPREIRREFWRYTAPRGIARLAQIAIQRADVVLIGAMLGLVEAAVYTAATRFVTIGQMGVRAIQMVLSPRFTQLVARRDMTTVAQVFQISTAWSMLLMWPFYGMVASGASLYLDIFGEGYNNDDSVLVVVVMAIGMMMATAGGPLDTLLLMSGRSMASLVNGVASALVNVALCLALIPAWGIVGAAVAWALAVLLRNGMGFIQVRNDLRVSPLSRIGGLVAAASVICFVVPAVIVTLLGRLSLTAFGALVVAGALAYAGIVWRFRYALALTVLHGALRTRRGH